MKLYYPDRVFIEPEALNYPLGNKLYRDFTEMGIRPQTIPDHNRITGIPGKGPQESYYNAKKTLVVGVKKTLEFETCKPSAHYQFPLVTSCPGHCQYCYLQTTLGKKPYLRVYVNLNEIFDSIERHIEKKPEETVVFEGASSGDPLALEHLTGSLAKTIEFFAQLDRGRFRFVTKFTNISSLIPLSHNEHTRVRFSINSPFVEKNFEHGTPTTEERISAAQSLWALGYPIGFIIAPIYLYNGWEEEYLKLLKDLKKEFPYNGENLTFELIQHRFTNAAKKIILERFPSNKLEMVEDMRRYKRGKYGLGKWVYPKEAEVSIENFFRENIGMEFPKAEVAYFT